MNHQTAMLILQSDHAEGNLPRGKKKSKRKSRIDRSMYCAELENMGRHIFDRQPASGKNLCRYCGMEDPNTASKNLQLVGQ
jgi:CRISPR/Cas system-associated protein Cas10 (large subunit of type III CRISPR-Cas system)